MSSKLSLCHNSSSRRFKLRGVLFGLVILNLAAAAPVWARETVVLQKTTDPPHGVQHGAFNNYMEQLAANQGNNHGGVDIVVQSFTTGSANSRALIRFDLSSIGPAGVKTVQLDMFLKTIVNGSRTYNLTRLTSTWLPNKSTWVQRVDATGANWTTPGGDATGTASTATTGTTNGVTMTWSGANLLTHVRSWLNGTASNNGLLIADSSENNGTQRTGTFAGHNDATIANRPKLTLELIQQVTGLTATAGSASVTLNWSYPPDIGTVTSAKTGVVIVRKLGAPVPDTVTFTDGGTIPSVCDVMEGGTFTSTSSVVVYVDATLQTSRTDTQSCNFTAQNVSNGNVYYYKVFTRDGTTNATTFYSSNAGSAMVPQVAAAPASSAAARYSSNWILSVGSAGLTPPGLNPGDRLIIGSNSPYVVVSNANTGNQSYAPLTVQGAVGGGRPPFIEGPDTATNDFDTTYIAASDGFVYEFSVENGQLLWVVNPSNVATPATMNNYQGGVAVLVQKFGAAGYTLPLDLVITCTNNTGSAINNTISAVNGGSGGSIWKTTVNMDVCTSTPLVDYTHGGIIVSTRDNAGTQSNLWRMDPNTGTITHNVHLGAGTENLDTSPSTTPLSEVVFVGASTGVIYAVRPDDLTVLATFTPGGSGAITGTPLIRSLSSPWQVLITRGTGGTASVRSVNFTCSTFSGSICTAGAFGAESWGTTVSGASAVITSFGMAPADKVYVGTNTGLVQQLNISTGAVEGTSRSVGGGSIVTGAPSLDTVLNRIYVGASNGRLFSFSIPF